MFQYQPNDQNYWNICCHKATKCTQDINTQVAIIGGGIAGLSAAQAFAAKGKKVTLLEQYYCGSGATGKAGGFITPNAELSFLDISHKKDINAAKNIWNFINNGLEKIRSNISNNGFSCNYKNDPGLFVATCNRTLKNLLKEYEHIQKLGYSSDFFDAQQIQSIIGTKDYYGGMTYNNSFGINTHAYCQELKKYLITQDVDIFEESPVLSIDNHTLTTPHAKITADFIIVCVDKFLPKFNILPEKIHHIQNFVIISEQLTDQIIQKIFPQKSYMVWDSHLIYNYFRPTHDNRIILGGGDLISIYSTEEKHNYIRGYKKLANYFSKTFPQIKINFEYQWPGQIGISKDLGPIAGPDKKYPHIYYITGSAGLSIATALATYSQEHLLENRRDLDKYFDPYRKYFINGITQKLLGKKLSFALNNFMVQQTLGCF
ncbi:FAD-binding oxidoreductase [Candidatus Dependentiae bacterium]|nr:FAD-binding oxidoreductase [Candidatus Dependentiae bacterium]